MNPNKNTTYLKITRVPADRNVNLSNYPNLITLDCSYLSIETILSIPPTLEELNCTKNFISQLDGLSDSLTKLICSYNSITKLNNLPLQLKYLDCSFNKISFIEMIPEGLEILICSYNKLIKLDDLPHTLIKLVCDNNFISTIDYLSPNLTELICNGNKIWKLTSLPSKLYLLDCSSNELSDFVKLDKLALLEDVNLSKNQITGIGVDLSSCTSLKILNCSSNDIVSVPKLPPQLTELYIGENPIQHVDSLPVELEVLGIDKDILNPNILLYNDLVILS